MLIHHLRPFPTTSLSPRSLTISTALSSSSSSTKQEHKLWSGLENWRKSPVNDLRLWGPTGPLLPSSDSISTGFYGLVSAASSLADLGALVLSTSDPLSKSHISHLAFSRWRRENLPVGSISNLPSSPARPPKPLLVCFPPPFLLIDRFEFINQLISCIAGSDQRSSKSERLKASSKCSYAS